ncbi:unnamed protein product (macronuclear) [Paramecium tetraurelia]|uniref:Uncharacterized protein n=1 Tax=Paramecium tetraurelia TaxID=5888 RepID=A0D775_PARTE|nr:uncharacterized protein GSPATT00001934001 [Paramecium tetraurelia]CAK78892.1 unnamed protein product [Paramecium tetraurelia]|eukprot:XP_001446289.1 hypothetical protein (macronuclear) [Paramecium tetraurelia strain d4-2]
MTIKGYFGIIYYNITQKIAQQFRIKSNLHKMTLFLKQNIFSSQNAEQLPQTVQVIQLNQYICFQIILPKRQAYLINLILGCDNRKLSISQQKEFLNFARIDPYGHSFMIYNSIELKNKVNQWQLTLPWITPHYAIKSNPIEPLIQDKVIVLLVNNQLIE